MQAAPLPEPRVARRGSRWPWRGPDSGVAASRHLPAAQLARQLLRHAERRLDGDALGGGVDAVLRGVPGWLAPTGPGPVVAPPDLLAVRTGEGPDVAWRHLGVDGQVRELHAVALPPALLHADDGAPLLLIAELPRGAGLDPATGRGAYLWAHRQPERRDERVAVLALEWTHPAPFTPAERAALTDLAALVDERLAVERLVAHLRDGVERAERQRVTAHLHDQLGQDLAHVAVALDLLARDHPTGDELREHAATVRGAVRALRVELAAHRDAETTGGAAGPLS